MPFSTMIQSATARVRPRSLQFDRSSVSSDSRSRHLASRDMSTLSPTPGARTSSLPLSSSRQYIDHTVRHHRSMLEVELTPKLPVAQPLFYPSVSESLRKKGQEELHSGGSIYTSNGIPTNIPSPTLAAPVPQVMPSSSGSDLSRQAPSDFVAVAPPASDNKNIVRRKLTGYVGFANLPNQWHRKSVRKGFNFNVMVVGESGLGKSTLVNTLFNTSLYPPKERKEPSLDIIPKTVTIQSISADIEEAGVRLRLTVVDTPGFGDFVNNDESWRPIVDNIEQRFDAYLDAENKINRMNIVDNRIHACVFFIQPTGHSLKPLDIEVMKRLHTKVNLIPVIAKADTLTDEEVAAFKARVCSGPCW
ncbi:hypothetical protein VTH82DRAFT_4364 [Thermothelomyces myriococcoides]